MALFQFGKKNRAPRSDARVRQIQVLGSGCKGCHDMFKAAEKAAQHLDLQTEVEYITDMEQIMALGIMRLPALVIDGQAVSMGRVLSATEIEKLLRR